MYFFKLFSQYFLLEPKFFSSFKIINFRLFLFKKTYFMYLKKKLHKIAMSAKIWGGVKALADASAKNASFFDVLPCLFPN